MSSWLERIQHLVDQEPVDAGTAGRPDRQLDQNLQHLKDLIELSLLGQAIVAPDVTVSSDVLVGQAVFWNTETARAEQSLAKVEYDPALQTLVSSPEAEVLGVVLRKSGSTLADIVIMGWVELDIANAVNGDVVSGRYFLSGVEPGKLVRNRPSLSIPVLFADGQGRVLVMPIARSWLEDHGHFRFELTCAPAGDHAPPSPGDPHVITAADSALLGWLPADDASFDGHAPDGAKFGYNLAAHTALNGLWPPLPLAAASLTWDKGQDGVGGTEVPIGDLGLVVIDQYGIWWMSDCYGDVPWPTDYTFDDGSETVDEGELGDCPRPELMRLSLHFSRTLFNAANSVVTSLRAKSGSILRVTGCDGEAASTGDLEVNAILSLLLDAEDAPGHLAIKSINEDGKFDRGPIVEGLIVVGSGLTAASTAPEVIESVTVHRGRVTLTISLSPADKELAPAIVRLSDTRDRMENGVPYVGFPAGYAASIRLRYDVPPDGVTADNPLSLKLIWLGTLAGQPPTLTVTYRVIPAATGSPQTLPASDTSLTMPTPPVLASASQYYLATVPGIEVNPGDTVLVTIARPVDAYAGEMGLIRATAVLG